MGTAWLEDSVLQPYVSRYGAHLRRGRYAPSTQRIYLCCVAHFAHWLTGERYGLNAIGEAVVACFLSEHMPACACPYPVRRLRHELRAALARLLEVLRADGVGTLDPALDSVVSQELARFDAHMHDVWGLADTTRRRRGRVVGEFLLAHFGDQPITMSTIGAASVRRFVIGEQGRSAGSIGVIGGAIGWFRSMSGDRVSELAAAIPRAAHWRLASLPEVLTDAEIDELLRSFNQSFPSRRRAYAMVRCLIDLGLRSSEVVKLRLEDINWADGTITLVGTKSRRADVLPLPAATGSAIAAHLRKERPQTLNRAIFVRHVAPYDEPIEKGAVKRAVVAGYRRCGWTRTGVHILRHSMASRLLRTGAPMKDIADVLRHRCLDTSVIYAKVDLNRLTAVALPWPGSAS
ncbi:tyrosine-type recombinase/integrase [Xanthobacter autotrophicus]|uniref:tyrosine-type recombinase/integrase n=1 Tax=Xanthobacter autotrophicus TaxID=280 RepID=UPI0024A6DE41|nr:tyrosine-type recombinase/integrase [Xanthobacter autotrophicus]MDI4658245.1 tyrosine-type recombinase/integrase [Xanthobacter autotrophicus]